MTLRPRIAHNVAAVLGGAFVALIGFGSAVAIGLYGGLVPAVFGLLGLSLLCTGLIVLIRRPRLAITIDEAGIRLPCGKVFHRRLESIWIPREVIASISRHESLKGRLIEITLTTGDKVPIEARHYCELKEFLAHCKAHGLPAV